MSDLDIVSIAESNFLISFAVTIGIGLLQGAVLGRGIRNRFPSFKKHAKIVSLILLVMFSFNAASNVFNFANPDKVSVEEFSMPESPEEGIGMAADFLGLNAGFITVLATFVSISLMLFFRMAQLPKAARYFVFALSVSVVCVSLISRFTDYVPTLLQILMYAFYQLGITLGLFFVTRRKENDILSEIS